MVNQEQPEAGGSAPQTPAAPVFTGAARRRFTKAGAVAVGAVLTLKSQPGMAANSSGCVFATPSAAGSFNINHSRGPQTGYCNAVSPGYWVTHQSDWPKQPGKPNKSMWDMNFQQIFPVGSGSQFFNQKLGTVIGWGGGGAQDVARHLIAAYLNAMNGWTNPYLTTSKVVEIWNGYNSVAGYKPAGKVWSASDISNYIKGTWGEGTMWT